MLRCRPFRAARQSGGACRRTYTSTTCSRRPSCQLPGRRGVWCEAAPDGGSTGGSTPPSSRRLSSLEAAAEKERLQGVLAQQGPYSVERGGANGAASQQTAAAHPSIATGTAGQPAAEPEPGSWDDWMRYFYAMDDVVSDLESLHSDMEEAVAREDYRAAAALKAQGQALEASDCVGAVLDALDKAVAEERFEVAARLRDESSVGLLGWWVGRGDGDPNGHLLRVTQDFSRYVATAYTPRDITELLPNLQSSVVGGDPRLAAAVAAMVGSSSGGIMGVSAAPPRPDDLGLPVLELFLRPKPDGSGYDKQAAALYAPDAEAMAAAQQDGGEAEAVASTLAEFIATEGSGDSIVSVEQGRSEDGSTFVKIEISSRDDMMDGGDGDGSEQLVPPDVDDDDIRTIDDLAASVGMGAAEADPAAIAAAAEQLSGGSSSSASAADADGEASSSGEVDEAEQLQRWQQQAAGEVEGGDATGSGRGRSLREEVAAMTEALLQGGGGTFSDSEVEELQQQSQQRWGGGEGDEDDTPMSLSKSASQLGCILQRAPAKIEWEGRDRFVVTVTEPPAVAAARAAAEAEAAAAQAKREEEELRLKRPPLRIIYDGREQQRRGRGGVSRLPEADGSSGDSASTSSSSSSSSSSDTGSTSQQSDGNHDVEVTSEESDSEEISVLLSPQQQDGAAPPRGAQQQQQQQHQGQQDSVAEDSAALAEQIEAVRGELEAGRKPSKDKINEIARRALGLAIAQGVGTADASGNPLSNRWAALEGRTSYQRLKLDECVKTDPFSGLYVGTFGPHGPELLQVTRQMEGGREWAVATKLTGDPNVPAGTVSWKALIGRSNRLPGEMFPPEMGVTARYKGQGQVAQTGFTNAKWVEGELLVFAGDLPFVQGAQLGFTFDVRANQRYLIVLHRINLDELFPEED